MPVSAWETYRPVTIDLTKTIRKTIPALNKSQPIYTTISLPVFSVSGIPWLGASFITTEFRVNLGVVVSLIAPIIKPSGVNFCLAVRWPSTGAVVARYKIWDNVGELLSFPAYTGQTIPNGNFALEIWSSQLFNETSLSAIYKIKTSILGNFVSGTNLACSCSCDTQEDATDRPQSENCGIFNPWNVYVNPGYSGYFPMTFDSCLKNIL